MSGRSLKDLDKIEEMGRLSLTSGQARSLLGGVAVLLILAILLGVQLGRVLAPADQEQPSPNVASADRSIAEILEAYEDRGDGLAGGNLSGDPAGFSEIEIEPMTETETETEFETEPEIEIEIEIETEPEIEPEIEIEIEPEIEPSTDVSDHPEPLTATDPMAGLPPTRATGSFAVQLAAYPSRTDADELVATVQGAGIDAYAMQAEVNGSTWYRVRVGRFSSRGDAATWLATLGQYTPFDPIVVKE